MKPIPRRPARSEARWRALVAALLTSMAPLPAWTQEPAPREAGPKDAPVPQAPAPAQEAAAPQPAPPAAAAAPSPPEEVQLSFNGANIEVVIKWLAEVTGKSIAKHKTVNVQLTIVSSKKLPVKEAVQLVYRALALEGFSVVETRNVILIVPENMESKVGTDVMDVGEDGPLEGKQVIVKVFEPAHAQVEKLKDKLRGVLSEKGRLEADDRANKIIVTDHADNVRMIQELMKALDVETVADLDTQVFQLRYAEADTLASLLSSVFSDAGSSPAPAGRPEGPQPPPQPGAPAPPRPGGAGVRILPDRASNRLVVTAPRGRLPEIKTLIETLDSAKPADMAVRVIELKHATGKNLAEELAPLYQKIRGGALKDTIEIAAHSRSNALIVLSSEANHAALKELVAKLDTDAAQEKAMKAFVLRNADAEDVATQLTDLHQNNDESRYYYYSRRSQTDEGETRFVADRRRNAVIAIAPPGSFESIERMIRALDEPVEGENLAPKIYQMKFVSATDIEEVLNQLFLKKQRQRGYWDYEYGSEQEDHNVGRLYGKVRIASEPYTNSLIVASNSRENFEAVEGILKQLDVPSEAGSTTLNAQLKYAKAVTVANNVNILFAQAGAPGRRQRPEEGRGNNPGGGQGQPGQPPANSFELEEEVIEESYFPWLGGGGPQEAGGRFPGSTRTLTRPVSDLVGKVRVVADVRTNSLMITSNAHFFPQVLKVVNDLDVPTAQVLIEARIIEVARDDKDRLGIRWSPDGARIFDSEDFDDSIIGKGAATYREVFAGRALADAMRTGILDASVSLDILIQFLAKNSDSRVRAEPRINVADNERGKLFVGARVPFISGSLNTPEGGRSDSFEYKDVGIILEVTPHINNKNEVALKVRVESSQLRPGETLFGGAIIDTRNYRTNLTVHNEETLVLGGIIQKEEAQIERKVPLLGDIPLLGWFFKKRDSIVRDVELMVFLRPKVTQSPEDVEALMKQEDEKAPRIQAWDKHLNEESAEERRKAEAEAEKAKPPPREPLREGSR